MIESAGALQVGAWGMPLLASTLSGGTGIHAFDAGSVRGDQALPYLALFQGERQTRLFVSFLEGRGRSRDLRAPWFPVSTRDAVDVPLRAERDVAFVFGAGVYALCQRGWIEL